MYWTKREILRRVLRDPDNNRARARKASEEATRLVESAQSSFDAQLTRIALRFRTFRLWYSSIPLCNYLLHPEVLDSEMSLGAIQDILLELIAGCRRVRQRYTLDGKPRQRGLDGSPELRGPWVDEDDAVEIPIDRFS